MGLSIAEKHCASYDGAGTAVLCRKENETVFFSGFRSGTILRYYHIDVFPGMDVCESRVK